VSDARRTAREVLERASTAIRAASEALDARFERAVELLERCDGRVVVSGMGKAGFVAQKLSATLASTGTPSLYLHPGDALHGDLGRVVSGDVAVLLSGSGETEELLRLVGPLERLGVPIVALVGDGASALAARASVAVVFGRHDEAGHGLAPTTSTTVMLAIGDALAMCVAERRAFTPEQFYAFHPAGALGRRMMRVGEVMRRDAQLPTLPVTATIREALVVMTETPGRPGAALAVDADGRLVGLFTDGDLRRQLERGHDDLSRLLVDVMCRAPKTVRADDRVSEAAALLRRFHVDQVPVVDEDGRLVGLLDVQDLLAQRLL
jgi:arabinose-5-phosphate isomerase